VKRGKDYMVHDEESAVGSLCGQVA
jgi:hypothetical protein